MECPHCHGQLPDNLQVCFLCGQPITGTAAGPAAVPQGFAPDPSGSGLYYSSEYLWANGAYVRRITWFDPATGSLTPYDYPEQPPAAPEPETPAPTPVSPPDAYAPVSAPVSMPEPVYAPGPVGTMPGGPSPAGYNTAHMPGGYPPPGGGKTKSKARIVVPIVIVLVLIAGVIGGHFLGFYQLPLLPAVARDGADPSGPSGATGSPQSVAPPSALPDTPIAWQDATIEKLVRDYIGKPQGDILPSELRGITIVSISGGNGAINEIVEERDTSRGSITTLADLRYFTSLQKLEVMYQQISDISPVSGLTSLTLLNLHNNNISDISPISGLVNLVEIKLGSNHIADLSPLAPLTGLQKLYLHDNSFTSIDALAPLTNLTTLVVASNRISDISVVRGMTKLEFLNVSGTDITDLSDAAHVPDIDHSLGVDARANTGVAGDGIQQTTHDVADTTGFTLSAYKDPIGRHPYFMSGKWVRDDGKAALYIHGYEDKDIRITIFVAAYGELKENKLESMGYFLDDLSVETDEAFYLYYVEDGALYIESSEKAFMIWEEQGVMSPDGLYFFSQPRP